MKKREKIILGIIISIIVIRIILVNTPLPSMFLDYLVGVGEEKTYCTDDQRNVDACIEIYQPVCGYPEERTYSNSCFACMEEEIIYWVGGECDG